MFEALAGALATPGLPWIIAVTTLAGLVYGFAGFGAALIFMPVATVFVPPALAISSMALIALASFVTVVPQAWAIVDKRQAVTMVAIAAATIPFGLWVVRIVDPLALRWALSAFVAATLLALLTGWRRTGPDTPMARAAVAGVSGFTGGAVGINGPVVVLFHLSGQASAAEARAETIVFLSLSGFLVLPMMALQGLLPPSAIALGLLLLAPYAAGSLAGRWLFRPERSVLYRRVAYTIVGLALVVGLPIWT